MLYFAVIMFDNIHLFSFFKKEAQLSQSDRAMRHVSWDLVSIAVPFTFEEAQKVNDIEGHSRSLE